MGASFFSFKQFTVSHEHCAMKVGTDGVLLGAWASADSPEHILDIGTGSGLIALMLAQRFNAHITGIDIDSNACYQAQLNFINSPWQNRLQAIEFSLSEFSKHNTTKFDLIVSNPPFFVNSLKNPNQQRTLARHAFESFHQEIVSFALQTLSKDGKLCLILPIPEGEELIRYALSVQLYCTRKTYVLPKPGANAKRLLIELSPENNACLTNNLLIETDTRHVYSDDFAKLLKDFYLKL